MDEQLNTAVAVPGLPELTWVGGHPLIQDAERRGTRLMLCVRCGTREGFEALSCERGMIVHLIDPADVHAAPAAFDGSPWAEPGAIVGAHAHWRSQGFIVVRKPDGPTNELLHPRFRPCPRCNRQLMLSGELSTHALPERYRPAAAAGPVRGRHAWARQSRTSTRTRTVESVGDPGKWQAQYRSGDLWHDIGDAQVSRDEAVAREWAYFRGE